MLLRVLKHNRRRWCIAALMALLGGCAHDPAPKARCHGPWIWITPAGGTTKNPDAASTGTAGGRGPSDSRLENVPSAGHAPAQPAAGGPP
jgi:hypothetical protein